MFWGYFPALWWLLGCFLGVLGFGGDFFGRLGWFFCFLGGFRVVLGVFRVGFSVRMLGGLGEIGGDK